MEKVKDFRPISLTTTTYKFLAKVLAERLRHVISHTISFNQSPFLSERQIMDPILIANEIVEYYRIKKKSGWILKLDLEKAFALVDWISYWMCLAEKALEVNGSRGFRAALKTPSFLFLLMGDREEEFMLQEA